MRSYLQSTYPPDLRQEYPCAFQVLSTGELSRFEDPTETTVALTWFLYRVTVNEALRNAYQAGRTPPGVKPALPVDLHWMMTVWASSSTAEHLVFAWAMKQLDQQTLLDASLLATDADWARGDVVHVLPEELPIEDTMRIWDAVEPSYRLSASYVARVVKLEAPYGDPPAMVVRQLNLGDRAEVP